MEIFPIIPHDLLAGFVANEHIDWTNATDVEMSFTGSDGSGADAPDVLTVTGGTGGYGYKGSDIPLTTGAGGDKQAAQAGAGGDFIFSTGAGGSGVEAGGIGGDGGDFHFITGAGGSGPSGNGSYGNIYLVENGGNVYIPADARLYLDLAGDTYISGDNPSLFFKAAVGGRLSFYADGDTDDYITMQTASHQPTLRWVGCQGKITADGGMISFDNENIRTTGNLEDGTNSLTIANAKTAYDHSQIAGGDSVHVSTTENSNWDAAYAHSLDNSQAHSDYLINNGDDSTNGTLTTAGLLVNGIGIIDDTNVEAFLVRKDSDGGDILLVDTTNSEVEISGAKFKVLSTGEWQIDSGVDNDVKWDFFTKMVLRGTRYEPSAAGANIIMQRARGTPASPDYLIDGDTIAGFNLKAWNNGSFTTGNIGRFTFTADGNHGVNDCPTQLNIFLTPSGSVTQRSVFKIRASGNVESIGTIQTTSADNWDLNDYTAGTVTDTGYVTVTINGTEYKLLARLEP